MASYNKNTDYAAEIQKAVARGDNAAVGQLIKQRQAKIAGEGLDNKGNKVNTGTTSNNKSSNKSTSGGTVNAGSSGTAQAGLSVGTIVNTEGGQYRIVDKNTPGAVLNPASGYYSVKVESTAPAWMDGLGSQGALPTQLPPASQYYNDAMSEYSKQLDAMNRAQQEAIRQQTQATVQSINSNIPGINQGYEAQQRENYISNEKAKYGMSDYLSAMGYSGGMAESTALGLQSGYQDQRRLADQEKNNALTNIQNLVSQAQLTGDTGLSNLASQHYQNYLSAMQSARQGADARSQWDAQYAMQQQQYSDSQAQQGWQNQMTEKEYAANEAYRAAQLRASSNKSASGGGSGSVAKSEENVINAQPSGNYDSVLNNVKMALGGSNAGSQSSWNVAINYIQDSLKRGLITNYEAEQMLAQLGLR